MIPFNIFRRRIQSPTAQLYYSGLLDSVDYWGKKDRETVIEGIKLYSKYYALDWALTSSVIIIASELLTILLYNMIGRPYAPDYFDMFLTIVLCALLVYVGALHIIDSYLKALDLKVGGEYDGL